MVKYFKYVEQVLQQKNFDDVIRVACEGIKEITGADGVAYYKWDEKNSSLSKKIEVQGKEVNFPEQIDLKDNPEFNNVIAKAKEEKSLELIQESKSKIITINDKQYLFLVRENDNLIGAILFFGKENAEFEILKSFYRIVKMRFSDLSEFKKLHQATYGRIMAGHDMRSTLQVTLSAAQMLAKKIPRDKITSIEKNLIDNLEGSIKLLTFLTEVPDVSQPWEPNLKKISFWTDVIAPVVGVVRWLAKVKNLNINYHINTRIPKLWLDKSRMQQLVYNILTNCIKYNHKSSTNWIDIKYIPPTFGDRYHIINFEDYGIGIDENEKEKIFELGYRSKDAMKVSFEGQGIGLASAKIIAKKHRGNIEVTNLKNPTIFTLKLPISAEEVP
jgi:signal transduction histidine kinase